MSEQASARFLLIGGGARSGKSCFALERALELGERRAFIATAEARDSEMLTRIERHQAERGQRFDTLEVPLLLPRALSQLEAYDVVLIDCLTLWVSNLMGSPAIKTCSPEDVLEHIQELVNVIQARPCHIILVSNEVGLGTVPGHPVARAFRDHVGTAHQLLASVADEVAFAAFGCMLSLKPQLALLRPLLGSASKTDRVDRSRVES